jgi:hypothetical protein
MGNQEPKDEWIRVAEDGSSPDLSREEATYQREKEWLVRDHLGKIAVIRFDEVVGVYDDLNEAIVDACQRFGRRRMIFREITAHDEPEYIGNIDPNHPSFRRID